MSLSAQQQAIISKRKVARIANARPRFIVESIPAAQINNPFESIVQNRPIQIENVHSYIKGWAISKLDGFRLPISEAMKQLNWNRGMRLQATIENSFLVLKPALEKSDLMIDSANRIKLPKGFAAQLGITRGNSVLQKIDSAQSLTLINTTTLEQLLKVYTNDLFTSTNN